MEILKQENFKPLTFEKIAILIYAANNGFFDDFELEKIKGIEKELLHYLETEKKEILDEIIDKKDLDEDLENRIREVLIHFFEQIKK
jgi:F-type H+-transporting ATPase subunit alpha